MTSPATLKKLNANKQLGNAGEQFVMNYLQKDGFMIVDQNYRKFFGEIDIIAHKKELYIFVEVKTRRSDAIAMEQLISMPKQLKIIKTAQTFIAEKKLSNHVFRFDVALVIPTGATFSVNYIENAFTSQESGRRKSSYYE